MNVFKSLTYKSLAALTGLGLIASGVGVSTSAAFAADTVPVAKIRQSGALSAEVNALNNYLFGLQYDPKAVVAVNGDGIKTIPPTQSSIKNGVFTVIKYEKKNFDNALVDLSVLEANNSTVYPGAIVLANQNLAHGNPTVLAINSAPLTMSVDLPGLVGNSGKMRVYSPSKSSTTAAINKLLENWRKISSTYSHSAARMSYDETMVNSKEQLEAKFGLGFTQAAKSLDINFDAVTKHESQTAIAKFDQIFYTVSVDGAKSPAAFFGPGVTPNDLKLRGVSKSSPPAYVSSISYGRQILVKLESDSKSTDVQAAFKAVLDGTVSKGNTEIDTKYQSILDSTKVKIIVLGGSAATGAKVISGGIKELKDVIAQEADYSASVPAVPVSYTVNYIKDNQRAIVSNTGEYIQSTAETFTSGKITFSHYGGYMAKFSLKWKEVSFDSKGNKILTPKRWSGSWQPRTSGYTETIQLPANATDIRIVAGEATGLAWDPWWTLLNETVPLVGHRTVEIGGTTLNPYVTHKVE